MLKNVLRVHSVTFNNKWLEGLESNLVDSATSKLEVNDEYYWFAKECRYPVFEYHIQNKSFTCKPNEEHDITFNCMGYAPGIYVIYINVNGIATCEKFRIK